MQSIPTSSTPGYRFYTREFLNDNGHHSVGNILVYVGKTDLDKNTRSEINFTICDCSRQINLEFPIRYKDERQNSLYKIDLLIKTMQGFKKALLAECRMVDKRESLEKKTGRKKTTLAELRKIMQEGETSGNTDS